MKVRNYSEKQQEIMVIQGQAILSLRKPVGDSKQLNQRELANMLGVSAPTIRNLEVGRRVVGRQMICSLAVLMTDTQLRAFVELIAEFESDEDVIPIKVVRACNKAFAP